jgi:hypothetical protein
MRFWGMGFLFFFAISLGAIAIPFSHEPVLGASNQLPPMISLDDPKGKPAPLETRVYLWYDEEALYVEFQGVIDSTFEKGEFSPRDYGCISDKYRLQVSTCPDDQFVYMFYAEPLKNLSDTARSGINDMNGDWNSHYSYTSEITDSLWIVRMRILFKDLRIQGKPPYHWRFNVLRSFHFLDPASQYGWPQVDTSRNWNYYIELMSPLELDHEINKAHNYHISPYFSRTYDLMSKSETFDPDHIGGNLEYRPAGNVSIKAAMNPDFSETPQDNESDTSNLQYAQYLSENRFFFIEDLNAFDIDESYLYTRAIAQPQYALKITGNSRHLTYAMFQARDKKVRNEWDEVINSDDLYTVAGVRPHTKTFSMQFDAMNRYNADENRDAWTFYAKPKWEITQHHTLFGSALYTDQIRPGERRKRGTRFAINEESKYEYWSYGASMRTVTIDFDPAIASPGSGYNNGFWGANAWINFSHYYYEGKYQRINGNFSAWSNDHYQDDFGPNGGVNVNGNIMLRNDLNFGGWGGFDTDFDDDVLYHERDFGLSLGIYHWDWLGAETSVTFGTTYNYSLMVVKPQDQGNVSINGSISPYMSYSLGVSRYIWRDMPADYTGDDVYDIGNFDLTLNFSAKVFLTSGIRYNNYEYDQYDDAGEHTLWLDDHVGSFATLRYDYSDNYQFFLGYNGVTERWNDDYQDQSKTAWFKVNAFF